VPNHSRICRLWNSGGRLPNITTYTAGVLLQTTMPSIVPGYLVVRGGVGLIVAGFPSVRVRKGAVSIWSQNGLNLKLSKKRPTLHNRKLR